MTAVHVVPIAVPFLINVPADMLTFARCVLSSPHTVTGDDLYEIFRLALVIARIEKLLGIAPVPFTTTVVLGAAIVNDSTSDTLWFPTLSVVSTLR